LLNCNTFNDDDFRTPRAFIMLSNPTNNLQNRQRLHRRQNSTPNAFDSVKVHDLPTIQRHGAHRRGMSLDTRRRQTPPQDYNTVRNTNQGYQTTSQHILRETQQQRLARPGQNQFAQFDNDENYLNSPSVTPQRQSFDAGCTNQYGHRLSQSEFQFPGPINTIISVDPHNYNGNQDLNLYQTETVLTPSAYLDFSAGFENSSQGTNSQSHSRRSSAGRRISGGIMDRVAQFEHLALQSPCRPTTPPNQNISRMYICEHLLIFANIHRLLSPDTSGYST
jgi:regulatory protein SWI5